MKNEKNNASPLEKKSHVSPTHESSYLRLNRPSLIAISMAVLVFVGGLVTWLNLGNVTKMESGYVGEYGYGGVLYVDYSLEKDASFAEGKKILITGTFNEMEFDCWDVNGERKQPGESIMADDSTKIVALWKKSSGESKKTEMLAVSFYGSDDKDESLFYRTVFAEPDVPFYLPSYTSEYYPEGKVFDHWSVRFASGETVDKYPGETIIPDGDIDVQAEFIDGESPSYRAYILPRSGGGREWMSGDYVDVNSPYILPYCSYRAPVGTEEIPFAKPITTSISICEEVRSYEEGGGYIVIGKTAICYVSGLKENVDYAVTVVTFDKTAYELIFGGNRRGNAQ